MVNYTIKQLIIWQREDFKAFEIKHDLVHTELNGKIDNLNGFMWKAIGGTTLLLGLITFCIKLVF